MITTLSFKQLGGLVSLLAAIIAFVLGDEGTGFLALLLCIISTLDDFGSNPTKFSKVSVSFLRKTYRNSGNYVRKMVLAGCFLGSIIIFDKVYELYFMWYIQYVIPNIDAFIKRIAPMLPAIFLIIFIVNYFSNFCYRDSEVKGDVSVRRYEILLYGLGSLLVLQSFIIIIGVPTESAEWICGQGRSCPVIFPYWSSEKLTLMLTCEGAVALWFFGTITCLWSRHLELNLRERYVNFRGSQRGMKVD